MGDFYRTGIEIWAGHNRPEISVSSIAADESIAIGYSPIALPPVLSNLHAFLIHFYLCIDHVLIHYDLRFLARGQGKNRIHSKRPFRPNSDCEINTACYFHEVEV